MKSSFGSESTNKSQMQFSFLEQFNESSNIDLLKIIGRPDDYQAEAIVAAKEILKSRNTLESETMAVNRHFEEIENQVRPKSEKINSYKEKVEDLLAPSIKLSTNVKSAKWLNFFLMAFGLYCTWSFGISAFHFIEFLQCKTCVFDVLMGFNFVDLVFNPVVFYFFFKKRNWCWILIFADIIFAIVFGLGNFFIYIKYFDHTSTNTLTSATTLIFYAIFASFFWNSSISSFFGVSRNAKKNTVIFFGMGAIIILVALMSFLGL